MKKKTDWTKREVLIEGYDGEVTAPVNPLRGTIHRHENGYLIRENVLFIRNPQRMKLMEPWESAKKKLIKQGYKVEE